MFDDDKEFADFLNSERRKGLLLFWFWTVAAIVLAVGTVWGTCVVFDILTKTIIK